MPKPSEPEIHRQVRQQRADIDALYELVEGIDHKVDALDAKLDRRVDGLDAKLDRRVDGLDAKLDRRVDELDGRFDELSGQLSQVLRQLGG